MSNPQLSMSIVANKHHLSPKYCRYTISRTIKERTPENRSSRFISTQNSTSILSGETHLRVSRIRSTSSHSESCFSRVSCDDLELDRDSDGIHQLRLPSFSSHFWIVKWG
ncbi:hypothetical protein TNIN_10921 [Trichonephila inaurata madagascariensis]|uniref:Uncharacterized protein n=1 Tax=Trichonephila inaurata madagascariensis TaxID=2747483 RepID=A0A8X6XYS2_9ARAC|nr:hypothetical protein TNIN_10921 [Trichonephila inaurata madagascariensis]